MKEGSQRGKINLDEELERAEVRELGRVFYRRITLVKDCRCLLQFHSQTRAVWE